MVLTATGQHLAKRARILPRAKFGYKVPTRHLASLFQPGKLLLTLGRAQGIKLRQGFGARAVEPLPRSDSNELAKPRVVLCHQRQQITVGICSPGTG